METPTLNSLFAVSTNETIEQPELLPVDGTPTLMPFFDQPTASVTVRPTELVNTIPIASSTPRPTAVVETFTVFGDLLDQNWTLENSSFFDYNPEEDEVSYNGRYSLAATPETVNGRLIFAVAPDADEEYLRDDVLAVRFWLFSGDDYIATDDLSVTILGSNEFPYWVEDDDSVQVDDSLPTFSQTRLYFLNVDEDIPPETWIQIEVWLDDLIFDPDYRYVTGIVIENDEDFLRTFYIDDLELVIEE